MKVILVCGYKTHGKDYFFHNSRKEDYLILSKRKGDNLDHFFQGQNKKRIAFADCVKDELSVLGIDVSEKNKEIRKYIYENNLYLEASVKNCVPIFSARDIFIKHANDKKKDDINVWVKIGVEKMSDSCYNVVTDWRFLHEIEYLKNIPELEIVTLKIFNLEKEIPNISINSEHDLDNFLTDFLLVPISQSNNIENVFNILPIYKDYHF